MEFLPVTTLEFERFFLILVRVGSVVFAAPVLGSTAVPPMIKAGLAVAVSIGLYPVAAPNLLLQEVPLYDLAGLALGEVMLGASIGLMSRLFITAVDMGAEVMGFQMGFGIVTAVDPSTQAHTALLAQFQSAITALVILATNAHYYLFSAIADSFGRISLMEFGPNPNLWTLFLRTSTQVFVIALKFAAPVTVALLLSSIALGIVARTVPQMNIFIVGISLQIVVGFSVLFFSVSMLGLLYSQVMTEMGGMLFRLVRAF